jgi:hypothetical protein
LLEPFALPPYFDQHAIGGWTQVLLREFLREGALHLGPDALPSRGLSVRSTTIDPN